ncbi:MAG: polysaccharide deacetylase family protein [Rhodospirillales bacterium]|nr:polysaccharide deacetylase family protein [Alphaproteobacteria bacterium]MCB9986390.1 polysaccharide deacetylase family protein [Rhodospirillales bacterium]USO07062.1 MAG: polysaccharide deacetylase family protein [Rhodospirillales bacterium]
MRTAYLTIDDSPSPRTDDLVDALAARGVPAILFCRGDLLEQNPEPVIRAIRHGFLVGSHGYEHKRASVLGYDAVTQGVLRTDALIDAAYANAGVVRPGRYHRFAYMDRGMGAWFVEPQRLAPDLRVIVSGMIREGLGNDPASTPTHAGIETKNRLQAFLSDHGFASLPAPGVTHAFFAQTEMHDAIDAMFTFSTSDWAVTERHRGKFGVSDVSDLKARIDADPYLARDDSAHIILAHDQAEIHDTVVALVDHMLDRGLQFMEMS